MVDNIVTESCSNNAVISWLEQIFQERYGIPFRIIFLGEPVFSLRLEIPGHPGEIIFTNLVSAFWGGAGDPSYQSWDPRSCGIHSDVLGELPAPGLKCPHSPLIDFSDGRAEMHYDFPGLVYWSLNRLEEIGFSELDKHGRYPAKASHALRNGYLDRPVVDEWFEVLAQVIKSVWPGFEIKKRKYSINISHDVDWPALYSYQRFSIMAKTAVNHALWNKSLLPLFMAPLAWLLFPKSVTRFDPANTFDWLMDISDKYGCKNAFYFICGNTNPNFDANYRVEDPAIRALLKRIADRGHEIGLHPSYGTYLSPDLLVKESSRLQKVCEDEAISQSSFGSRMHFLRWDPVETARGLEKAGMVYDSTLGYAESAGFRCGTCHEYPLFDHVQKRTLSVRERPLVAMETSLFDAQYMNINSVDEAVSHCLDLKNKCKAVGGDFNLLWHNSGFKSDAYKQAYIDIVSQ